MALPELDARGHDRIAAPRMWTRNFLTFESCVVGFEALAQQLGRLERLALLGRPRGDAVSARPAFEIFVRLFVLGHACEAFHPHLTFELGPVQNGSNCWILRKLTPFTTQIRRVKTQPAAVEPAQQHDARRRCAGAIDRRHAHANRGKRMRVARRLQPTRQNSQRLFVHPDVVSDHGYRPVAMPHKNAATIKADPDSANGSDASISRRWTVVTRARRDSASRSWTAFSARA